MENFNNDLLNNSSESFSTLKNDTVGLVSTIWFLVSTLCFTNYILIYRYILPLFRLQSKNIGSFFSHALIFIMPHLLQHQHSPDANPMLSGRCDAGPTSNHHWQMCGAYIIRLCTRITREDWLAIHFIVEKKQPFACMVLIMQIDQQHNYNLYNSYTYNVYDLHKNK